MKIRNTVAIAAIIIAAGFGAQAATVTVDFEGDASGNVPNGFTSSGSSIVSFTDSIDSNLEIRDYGTQTDGKSLIVRHDDHSTLIMTFSQLVSNLSLSFGNDDPFYSLAGDVAVLQGFLGGVLKGVAFVTMNRDDIMNQTIGFFGQPIDKAVFYYGRLALGSDGSLAVNPINLIEVVDNVTFEVPDVAEVPLPASGLLLLGAGGLLAAARRKRAA